MFLNKTWLILLSVVLMSGSLAGQAESFKLMKGKLDVGMNVTSVLSSFTGNGSFLEAQDLPLFFRFNKGNSAIRFGLGGRSRSNEFFDNIAFTTRKTNDVNFYSKVGLEKNFEQTNRWCMHGGVDFVGGYSLENASTFVGNNQIEIHRSVVSLGVSPFIGLKFALTPSLYLSADANLTYALNISSDKEFLNGNSSSAMQPRKEELETFEINPPLFLYLNYSIK